MKTETTHRLQRLSDLANTYWASRVVWQLRYAAKLVEVDGHDFEGIIQRCSDRLWTALQDSGAVTRELAGEVEAELQPLSQTAKAYQVICAGHAHIDMNWMWGYAETVAISLDSLRTVLLLMQEYPQFTFSQSQASIYQIVAEHDPPMLQEIKARIAEGRWEVLASTWVENDKNMPNGESQVRQLLYTRRYLADLLNIDPATLNIDFSPDTFGHPETLPEILAKGGVRYYFHIRGKNGDHFAYRWRGSSGAEVIGYMDPYSCIMPIEPSIGLYAPGFCKRFGVDSFLRVYGVGDHGGGPTRADLERVQDMATWPCFPTIRFGRYDEFYTKLDEARDGLPLVEKELNFVMTGCFSAQDRIKQGNRACENRLFQAESLATMSSLFAGGSYRLPTFEAAWRKVLFNQFHDIIPGSGVVDTREHAMGLYQEAMATGNTEAQTAMRQFAAQADTQALYDRYRPPEDPGAAHDPLKAISRGPVPLRAEGAGVGHGVAQGRVPHTERGSGLTRLYHIFNAAPEQRSGMAEIVVWNWEGDVDRMTMVDPDGNVLRHQIIEGRFNGGVPFWGGHLFMKVLVEVTVPACGYTTVLLHETPQTEVPAPEPYTYREESWPTYVLENDLLRVELDPATFAVTSLVDKRSGRETLDGDRGGACLRVADEDDSFGMTAWIVGRYQQVTPVGGNARSGVFEAHGNKLINHHLSLEPGSLRQWVDYEVGIRDSNLKVRISLDAGSDRLEYEVRCDWQEAGRKGGRIPQLHYWVPLDGKPSRYITDLPCGTISRDERPKQDVAGLSFCAVPASGDRPAVAVLSGCSYGYRTMDRSIALTLLRSSFDPDVYPEIGIHHLRFALCVTPATTRAQLLARSADYAHAFSFHPGTAHRGPQPTSTGFLSLADGTVRVSSIKRAEDGSSALVVRLYETEGTETQAVLELPRAPESATLVDYDERPRAAALAVSVSGTRVSVSVPPRGVETVLIRF